MREKITSGVFALILAVFFLLVMVMPKDERASVQENRPLANMPEVSLNNIFFGKFTTDYENYLTDNVAFRSHFVDLGNKLDKLKGIQKEESEKLVELNTGGKLVLSNGKIMEVFQENPQIREEYISVLNEYAKKMDKTNMHIMLVPTQIEFDETEYRKLSHSEKATIDEIYASLEGFETVNVYDKLKAHKNEYIYFRTDHHWTQRGAYLGYEAIMEKTGGEATGLEDLTHYKASAFLGYLFNQASAPEYSKYADDIEYFMGETNYEVSGKEKDANGNINEYKTLMYHIPSEGVAPTYGVFMGWDHAFAEIKTNNKNGKTALVIKDSYANALIPLLTENYETIIVIDPRNYFGTIDDLKSSYKIDDCFIINYVFTTTFSDYVNNLNRIK